ncbi:WEB family protein At3g51220-like [Gastrolobium bilobum]|uniref:WEB family protein At3g51220-like n=1 Tax=Gastrolobium bilobum TaxID=150636 RepID=UPI002AB323D0|nr:WEB family protein At3g51220-like [Gastrolobium bilobum]
MDREDGRMVIRGRAEIDTDAPFKSVKEAVMLFGERVLVGEIYANKLKEMRVEASETGSAQSRVGPLSTELEETKQSLQRAREEANFMAQCLKSLKMELEQTKKELEDTKARELMLLQRRDDPETEDLKFIANATNVGIRTQMDEEVTEFQKRRYVKFASPHALAQVIPNKDELLGKPPSVKKAKRKPLVPLIGWLFSKKKGSHEVDSPKA